MRKARPGDGGGDSSLRRLRHATLLLLGTFALILLGAVTLHLYSQYRTAVDDAFRTVRATTMTVQSHAARTFGETFRVIEGLADVYRTQRGLHRIDERALHELMAAKLAEMPYVSTFLILRPDGKRIASARQYPVGDTPDLQPLAQFRAPDSAGLAVGKLYRGLWDPSGAWFLPVSMPIMGDDGAVEAWIIAVLRPTYFRAYYDSIDHDGGGRVTMWTADGLLVAGSSSAKAQTGDFDANNQRYVSRLVTRGASQPVIYQVPGGDGVNGHAAVEQLPLVVSVRLPSRMYLTGWRGTRDRLVLGMGIVMLAMMVFAIIILKQITRTRENEQALRAAKAIAEEANDAKSRFLAHMSHEFRTPLNAIMGFSDIIKSKVMGDQIAPVYTTYADHIHRSGEHLLNIVNDILDMAKVESGAQSLQRQAVDMTAAIARSVSFVEQLARQFDLKIFTDIPRQLPRVSGDERFVRQVLINLLSNAIKFSAPGTTVTVRAAVGAGNTLDVAVIDRGPGIDPLILNRIGEPFLQGNPALTRAGQGTGLGLSICKHYMELLGGALVIESAPGTGTTAIMRFPREFLIDAVAA